MSDLRHRDWPPVISAANRPTWVRLRDVVVTLVMWALFIVLVERELKLVVQALQLLVGHPVDDIDAGLSEFLVQMRPAVGVILSLVGILGVATIISGRRRNSALARPQPARVPDSELASDLGLSEQELRSLRKRKIVALDVDSSGHVVLRSEPFDSSEGRLLDIG